MPTWLRLEEGADTLEQITHFVRAFEPSATTPTTSASGSTAAAAEPAGEFWTLDPVDGTKGFLRGDQYAVALGFIRDGQVRVGALGCPELGAGVQPAKGGPGTRDRARRESGCFASSLTDEQAEWTRLTVSSESRRRRSATAAVSRKGSHQRRTTSASSSTTLGYHGRPRSAWTARRSMPSSPPAKATSLLRLLSPSRPDYREKIWDQAAGSIVVEEAGGRVTDLDGKPLDFSHGRTLANKPRRPRHEWPLHDALLCGAQADRGLGRRIGPCRTRLKL